MWSAEDNWLKYWIYFLLAIGIVVGGPIILVITIIEKLTGKKIIKESSYSSPPISYQPIKRERKLFFSKTDKENYEMER